MKRAELFLVYLGHGQFVRRISGGRGGWGVATTSSIGGCVALDRVDAVATLHAVRASGLSAWLVPA